jgi:hypothetical protein
MRKRGKLNIRGGVRSTRGTHRTQREATASKARGRSGVANAQQGRGQDMVDWGAANEPTVTLYYESMNGFLIEFVTTGARTAKSNVSVSCLSSLILPPTA